MASSAAKAREAPGCQQNDRGGGRQQATGPGPSSISIKKQLQTNHCINGNDAVDLAGLATRTTHYSVRAGSVSPYWLARRANAMLSWMPTFSNRRALCVLMVLELRFKRLAMSS